MLGTLLLHMPWRKGVMDRHLVVQGPPGARQVATVLLRQALVQVQGGARMISRMRCLPAAGLRDRTRMP